MKSLHFSDGTVEALKWLALILMTMDHINKYLFNATLPMALELGRLCLPIFVILLAFNLARPDALQRGVYVRTMGRLSVFAFISTIPFMALGGLAGGWWPLNVFFTLFLIAAVLYLFEQEGSADFWFAAFIILFLGAFVEFWWMAIALGLSSWWFFKRPSWIAAIAVVIACASLWIPNRNGWALAALPLMVAASRFDFQVPRFKWAFYVFYPLHLTALWFIRIPMKKAGYLFF